MFAYYLELAFRGLRQQVWLTALIVFTIAIGIGSSMTVYTLLHTLSADPIPAKSSQLFVPYFPVHDPDLPVPSAILPTLFSYPDVKALQGAPAFRQAAMHSAAVTIVTQQSAAVPATVNGHATQADFFPMFDVPFRSGSAWRREDDAAAARVVVLTANLADELYPGVDAVGQTLQVEGRDHRIVGVMRDWRPAPRFYDAIYGNATEPRLFLPFDTAIAHSRSTPQAPIATRGSFDCSAGTPASSGYAGFLAATTCIWVQLWVELRNPAEVRQYRAFLDDYVARQQDSGRFAWRPRTELFGLREWLVRNRLVPDEIRVASVVAFGFLLVCLVNAVALMLARWSRRNAELAVRRALGAPRRSLFAQCLVETLVIGVLGGTLGLLLTGLGVRLERAQLPDVLAQAARVDAELVLLTLGLALLATVVAGLFPAWRASRVSTAKQLKLQ